jgi:hypothetical protein
MAVQKVRRAVERIDDPERASAPSREAVFERVVSFLGEHLLARVSPLDHGERRRLCLDVGPRHVVGARLLGRITS